MLDFSQPFCVCVVSPEGVACLPLRWASSGPCSWRFMYLQMWDEEENPLEQPWETPKDYDGPIVPGFWLLDLHDLPEGWEFVDVSKEKFQELQDNPHGQLFDFEKREWIAESTATRNEETDVEISHRVRCGRPAYKIKPQSKKTEADFPDLMFTHVEEKRIIPVTQGERLGAGIKNAALIQISRRPKMTT